MTKVFCEEHQFVHNICHLLMDNCFPMYVALKELDLLDTEIDFRLKKRPPQHNVLFPEIYGMFKKASVRYGNWPEVVQGKMIAQMDEGSTKETLFFPKMDDDPEACSCSNVGQYDKKEACTKNHYIGISNKRFFPHVEGFAQHILNWMEIPPVEPTQITVVRRTTFRMILNHDELVHELKSTGLKVQEVVLENLTFRQQMDIVRKTKVFVAGHGAALTYTMFLQPGCFALEVLPYGYAYDRYNKLAIARGEKYLQWTNPDESKAQHNFSRSWLGGIDTSVTVIDDPSIIKKDGKTGDALKKANKLRGWFRDQNTIVDCKAITQMVSENL